MRRKKMKFFSSQFFCSKTFSSHAGRGSLSSHLTLEYLTRQAWKVSEQLGRLRRSAIIQNIEYKYQSLLPAASGCFLIFKCSVTSSLIHIFSPYGVNTASTQMLRSIIENFKRLNNSKGIREATQFFT